MKDLDGLPKHISPKSRTQIWKENNRDRYNDYQKQYMRNRRKKGKEHPEDTKYA